MNFPRQSKRYDLLGTEAYRDLMANYISKSNNSILLISAFITKAGLRWLLKCNPVKSLNISIVTQWSPSDLLSGASDLDAYKIAKDNNWRFSILPNLHAKLLLIDNSVIFVGSANFTANGLSLTPGGNNEIGVCFEATDGDIRSAWGIFSEAKEIDESLYLKIKLWLDSQETNYSSKSDFNIEWPKEIHASLNPLPKKLWVADLPWTTVKELEKHLFDKKIDFRNDSSIKHDIRLFGLDNNVSVSSAFCTSKCFSWLLAVLENEPDRTVFYGRLTQLLHTSIVDDPLPYRKDIKVLLSNLLDYADNYARSKISIDNPVYSTRIRAL